MPFHVYEAEYQNESNVRRADWTNPDMATVRVHGPFLTFKEADDVAGARAWSSIDKCYHRVAITTSDRFDPRDPATHDLVVNPDLYWDRPRA